MLKLITWEFKKKKYEFIAKSLSKLAHKKIKYRIYMYLSLLKVLIDKNFGELQSDN